MRTQRDRELAEASRPDVESSSAIEQSSSLDTVVLDKTGTLTRGEPEVVEIQTTDTLDERTVLRLTAALERESWSTSDARVRSL
jgi:magnesium-transporting ATPase (P-type)